MRAVCRRLSLALEPLAYTGEDFNGIFAALAEGTCDAVIAGTTITPERAAMVLFSRPYLEFNQGIAVNVRQTPRVTSTADLRGLTAGIQKGNTSDAVARQLLAQGHIAASAIIRTPGSATRSTISKPGASASSSSCSR
jgi:polar amino acid transport system substrate-binding protein